MFRRCNVLSIANGDDDHFAREYIKKKFIKWQSRATVTAIAIATAAVAALAPIDCCSIKVNDILAKGRENSVEKNHSCGK